MFMLPREFCIQKSNDSHFYTSFFMLEMVIADVALVNFQCFVGASNIRVLAAPFLFLDVCRNGSRFLFTLLTYINGRLTQLHYFSRKLLKTETELNNFTMFRSCTSVLFIGIKDMHCQSGNVWNECHCSSFTGSDNATIDLNSPMSFSQCCAITLWAFEIRRNLPAILPSFFFPEAVLHCYPTGLEKEE